MSGPFYVLSNPAGWGTITIKWPEDEVTEEIPAAPERPIRDASHYPHVCPRCGGKAYVGAFNQIEHYDETKDATCR